MTSLDIGRTGSSEHCPYRSYRGVPDGIMLLYFAAVIPLIVLPTLLGQRACAELWEFEAAVTEEYLTVGRPESRDGPDIQVPLSQVTDVYLDMTRPRARRRISLDSVRRVRRRHGRSADGVRRGPFEVVEMGNGWLYTTDGFPPYLVVRTEETFVIVNYPNADRTRALHRELAGAWRRAVNQERGAARSEHQSGGRAPAPRRAAAPWWYRRTT